MAKYHVGKDGQARPCKAASPDSCPLAKADGSGVVKHFDDMADAQAYGERVVMGLANESPAQEAPVSGMRDDGHYVDDSGHVYPKMGQEWSDDDRAAYVAQAARDYVDVYGEGEVSDDMRSLAAGDWDWEDIQRERQQPTGYGQAPLFEGEDIMLNHQWDALDSKYPVIDDSGDVHEGSSRFVGRELDQGVYDGVDWSADDDVHEFMSEIDLRVDPDVEVDDDPFAHHPYYEFGVRPLSTQEKFESARSRLDQLRAAVSNPDHAKYAEYEEQASVASDADDGGFRWGRGRDYDVEDEMTFLNDPSRLDAYSKYVDAWSDEESARRDLAEAVAHRRPATEAELRDDPEIRAAAFAYLDRAYATSNVRDDLDESESKYYSDTDFRNQMLHAHDDGTYGTVDAVFGDAYVKSLEESGDGGPVF